MSADDAGRRSGGQPPKKIDSLLGEVREDEPLARMALRQTSVKNRRLQKGALKLDDVIKNDGWSVVREKYADMPRILERHARGKSHSSSEYGYASIQTEDVHGILDDRRKRVFCVVENALENFPEHALIKLTSPEISESLARKFRGDLLKKFGPVR